MESPSGARIIRQAFRAGTDEWPGNRSKIKGAIAAAKNRKRSLFIIIDAKIPMAYQSNGLSGKGLDRGGWACTDYPFEEIPAFWEEAVNAYR